MKEITLPSDYTGTLAEENNVIGIINENFLEIESMIQSLPDTQMKFDSHIADFEEYSIDVYFATNKKVANITINDNEIIVIVNDIEIKIDSDGNII